MALSAGHCVDLDVPWNASQAESDIEWDSLEEIIGKAVETLPKDGKAKPIVIGEELFVLVACADPGGLGFMAHLLRISPTLFTIQATCSLRRIP